MQQTTWVRGVAACSIALAATLAAGGVWAQGAVISAPGVDVRGGASGASVIVNGVYWGVDTPRLITIPDAKNLLTPLKNKVSGVSGVSLRSPSD